MELSLVVIDSGFLKAGQQAGRQVPSGKYLRLAPVQVEGAALPYVVLKALDIREDNGRGTHYVSVVSEELPDLGVASRHRSSQRSWAYPAAGRLYIEIHQTLASSSCSMYK